MSLEQAPTAHRLLVGVNYGARKFSAAAVRAAFRAGTQLAISTAAPSTKDCPYCRMAIPVGATRCPQCTSELR